MMGGSAGQQRVPPDFFRFLVVSGHCLENQDAYAGLFDATEAAIEQTRAVIDQTRKLKTALLQDLLTNGLPGRHKEFQQHHRLGQIPADWHVSRLRDNAEVTQGIALGPHRKPRQNATPYLRVANVQNGFVDSNDIKHIEATEEERAKYALREGDVLIVEGHANIEDLGRAALVPGAVAGLVFQNHLFRVRTKPKSLDARYLTSWINSPPGRRYFRIFGGTTSGLNTVGSSQIRGLQFPLPRPDEQRDICDLVESAERRVAALDDQLAQLKATQSALSQALLTGRVRVPTKGGE
jgi:type I restriction enzyme S subunit